VGVKCHDRLPRSTRSPCSVHPRGDDAEVDVLSAAVIEPQAEARGLMHEEPTVERRRSKLQGEVPSPYDRRGSRGRGLSE
jgi:hypothetical protein